VVDKWNHADYNVLTVNVTGTFGGVTMLTLPSGFATGMMLAGAAVAAGMVFGAIAADLRKKFRGDFSEE
jgi:predicted membrane channel-forming protein YqfA (hemolysin III family)